MLIKRVILLFLVAAVFQSVPAKAQDNYAVIRENIYDANAPGSRVYVINKDTGAQRTIAQMTNDVGGLENARYNPQKDTIEVSRSPVNYPDGQYFLDTYDNKTGKLISSVLIGTVVNNSGRQGFLADSVYRLPPDLSQDETAVGLSFSTIRGRWDGGVGVAFADGVQMGKVSAGINW